MASLPSYSSSAPSQRPPSGSQDASTSTASDDALHPHQPDHTSSDPPHSQEPQTDSQNSENPAPFPSSSAHTRPLPSSPPPPASEPRKCWICFADETEDTPTTSSWRSPCPCALTAHEACLLDWVADLEAPTSRKRSNAPPRIQCPQCKADITIARPRSLIVDGVGAAERIAGRMVVPGIFITLAGSLATGCWVHGLSAVYLVFGREDFKRLMGVNSGRGVSAKWGFGLPFIPVVLVMSRTALADNLLPVLPILFFATQIPERGATTVGLWPPSAAMTMATLPYLRGVYNEIYKRVFAPRMERWTKEIQPRAGETTEGDGAGRNRANEEDDINGNVGFELNLEVEIFEEEQHIHPPPQQELAAPAGQIGGANQGQGANPAPAPVPAQRQNGLIVSTSRVADTIIGALAFPAIAATMGVLIKVGLPKKWTTPAGERLRPGLLQTQWGRSIVGGCLFVVMKDMALLYSRYRLAQDHRKRRVVDYDRGKTKANGS